MLHCFLFIPFSRQPFQMHFHHKSAHITCLNGFKVLLIVVVTYATCVNSSITPDDITDAMNEIAPMRYCGKRLNDAIKTFCSYPLKNLIMKMPVKKSCKFISLFNQTVPNFMLLFFTFILVDSSPDLDFETFDLDRIASENYEDDMVRSRYKLDDTYFSNDIPFLYSQGNRRRRRGIVDECCRKPCFKVDLIRYCPTRGKTD